MVYFYHCHPCSIQLNLHLYLTLVSHCPMGSFWLEVPPEVFSRNPQRRSHLLVNIQQGALKVQLGYYQQFERTKPFRVTCSLLASFLASNCTKQQLVDPSYFQELYAFEDHWQLFWFLRYPCQLFRCIIFQIQDWPILPLSYQLWCPSCSSQANYPQLSLELVFCLGSAVTFASLASLRFSQEQLFSFLPLWELELEDLQPFSFLLLLFMLAF